MIHRSTIATIATLSLLLSPTFAHAEEDLHGQEDLDSAVATTPSAPADPAESPAREPAPAPEAPSAAANAEKLKGVPELIAKLRSEKFPEREEASKALLALVKDDELGPDAVLELRKLHAGEKDLEAYKRIGHLLSPIDPRPGSEMLQNTLKNKSAKDLQTTGEKIGYAMIGAHEKGEKIFGNPDLKGKKMSPETFHGVLENAGFKIESENGGPKGTAIISRGGKYFAIANDPERMTIAAVKKAEDGFVLQQAPFEDIGRAEKMALARQGIDWREGLPVEYSLQRSKSSSREMFLLDQRISAPGRPVEPRYLSTFIVGKRPLVQ